MSRRGGENRGRGISTGGGDAWGRWRDWGRTGEVESRRRGKGRGEEMEGKVHVGRGSVECHAHGRRGIQLFLSIKN